MNDPNLFKVGSSRRFWEILIFCARALCAPFNPLQNVCLFSFHQIFRRLYIFDILGVKESQIPGEKKEAKRQNTWAKFQDLYLENGV